MRKISKIIIAVNSSLNSVEVSECGFFVTWLLLNRFKLSIIFFKFDPETWADCKHEWRCKMDLRRVFARKSHCYADVISLFYARAHMRLARECAPKKIGRKKNFESDGMQNAIGAIKSLLIEPLCQNQWHA